MNYEVFQGACWESGACTALSGRHHCFHFSSACMVSSHECAGGPWWVLEPGQCAGGPWWVLEPGHQSLLCSVSPPVFQSLLALVFWAHRAHSCISAVRAAFSACAFTLRRDPEMLKPVLWGHHGIHHIPSHFPQATLLDCPVS